ncbi:MAG: hypothetical protein LBT37_05625 [Lactobacillaceae bacterium]|jgi:hypothetical protein|nr:hypothetical protein [Lactobacillaceae bacterium]
MAKWKNALLVGTLIIPMAIGAIEGVADAAAKGNRPTATDVTVHKYLSQSTDNSNKGSYYFGDGNLNSTDAFASGWTKVSTGYEFTAFNIPANAIKGYTTTTDQPKFSTTEGLSLNGTFTSWDNILEAVVVTAGDAEFTQGTTGAATSKKNAYTIKVKDGIVLAELQAALVSAGVNTQVRGTDTAGDAKFDDLANGNWIILETNAPANVSLDGRAVPMVLHLPMVNPAGTETGTNYWFDGATTTLELYAKNYPTDGDLTVIKYDSDDYASKTAAKQMAGAGIQLFQGDAAAVQAALQTEAGKNLLKAANTANSADKPAALAALQAFLVSNGATLVDYKVTTGSPAEAKFTGLTPGATYSFVELIAPDNGVTAAQTDKTEFILDATVKTVTLSNADAATANTDGGLIGGALRYTGSHVDITNDDFSIEKKVNVKGNADATSADSPFANSNFEAIDDDLGVARGQQFQWAIRSEINNATKLEKYDIVDTLPYQVNVNDFVLGLTVGGVYTSLIQVDNTSDDNSYTNGGNSGHGVAYDSAAEEDSNVAFSLTAAGKTFFANKGVYVEGETDEAALVASLIHVYGTTSEYDFDANNHAVTSHTDGQLTIETSAAFRAIIGDQLSYIDVTLNVQTNSAAQVGAINNEVELDVENKYDHVDAEDESETFDAGWEFKKTDAAGDSLAGAGFDLALLVTADNIDQIKAQLLGTTNLGTAVSEASLEDLAAAKGITVAEVTALLEEQADGLTVGDTVYFTHLTMDGSNQPVISMNGMSSSAPMGDIFWTTEEEWATTHVTGDTGYFQYCGLAAGQYTLIESIVPSGYTKMADQNFSLGNTDSAEYPFLTSSTGNTLGSDDAITGDFTGNHVEIKNYEKSMFPVTGAIGLVVMLVAGAVAMAYALVKRNKNDEA